MNGLVTAGALLEQADAEQQWAQATFDRYEPRVLAGERLNAVERAELQAAILTLEAYDAAEEEVAEYDRAVNSDAHGLTVVRHARRMRR